MDSISKNDKYASSVGEAQSCNQTSGLDYTTEKRSSIRSLVERQKNEAFKQEQKGRLLEELAYLLDKNPEVARILDLLEYVQR